MVVADLNIPSTLELKEVEPQSFTMTLTLPVIAGRVVRATPVLPECCVTDGEPTVREAGSSVIRTWRVECDPGELTGAPIGVAGLLGTAQEVLLTIETLDGRQYSQILRATRSFFIVPSPPSFLLLARNAGGEGMRQVVRRPELVLLVFLIVFLAVGTRAVVLGIIAFVCAQSLGQWCSGQNLMLVSAFLPRMLVALSALVAAMEIIRGQPVLRPGWLRPWWLAMALLGLLYGAAYPETIASVGLSRSEQGIACLLFALGAVLALACLAVCAREMRAGLDIFSVQARGHWSFWITYLAGIAACALFLYHATAPAFVGTMRPAVPLVTLVACATLGLWNRMWARTHAYLLTALAGLLLVLGLALSLQGIALPLGTLFVLGSLVLLGATLTFPRSVPVWFAAAVIGVTTLYHGWYAGRALLDNSVLPSAGAAGAVALAAIVYYMCFSAGDSGAGGKTALAVRVCGAIVVLLAILWRLAEYREWVDSTITSAVAMGRVRVPLLAASLALAAWIAWPRKRRFHADPTSGARVAPTMHWLLVAVAFFCIPFGTFGVRNPFFTSRAPTTSEATRIVSALLSDTYRAFNLKNENEAFDRLAENISDNLVADIYLDSRRRLTAGTREGAEVTVKDVSVISVDEALRNTAADNSFTYPCRWIVTARVNHWQHSHNRQNVYLGEITLQVEDDRWKIAKLTLKSEERVVLSWQTS
jgi:hydrogenase/urease accessory protein HupE